MGESENYLFFGNYCSIRSQSCLKHSAKWVNEVEWVSKVKVILWPWSKITQISKLNVWLRPVYSGEQFRASWPSGSKASKKWKKNLPDAFLKFVWCLVYQVSRPSVSWFCSQRFFLNIYRHEGHICHVTWMVWTYFCFLYLWRHYMKFGFNWPSGFWGYLKLSTCKSSGLKVISWPWLFVLTNLHVIIRTTVDTSFRPKSSKLSIKFYVQAFFHIWLSCKKQSC